MRIIKNFVTSLFLIALFCIVGFAKEPVFSAAELEQTVAEQTQNVFAETKNIIYQYYGKETFDEPEWIRVKNFLTWFEENKTALNKRFIEQYANTGYDLEKYIFAVIDKVAADTQLENYERGVK